MVDRTNKMHNEITPKLKSSLTNYIIISAMFIRDLARLGGFSKEAAIELANSDLLMDQVAKNLSELTNAVNKGIADKHKAERE